MSSGGDWVFHCWVPLVNYYVGMLIYTPLSCKLDGVSLFPRTLSVPDLHRWQPWGPCSRPWPFLVPLWDCSMLRFFTLSFYNLEFGDRKWGKGCKSKNWESGGKEEKKSKRDEEENANWKYQKRTGNDFHAEVLGIRCTDECSLRWSADTSKTGWWVEEKLINLR